MDILRKKLKTIANKDDLKELLELIIDELDDLKKEIEEIKKEEKEDGKDEWW